MTSFVEGNRFLFFWSNNFILLFKTTNNAIDGIKEVLLFNVLLVMTCGNKCGFVTQISDIGPRETRRLLGKEIDVNFCRKFNRLEVDTKDFFTLIEVRHVDINLTIKTTCTH